MSKGSGWWTNATIGRSKWTWRVRSADSHERACASDVAADPSSGTRASCHSEMTNATNPISTGRLWTRALRTAGLGGQPGEGFRLVLRQAQREGPDREAGGARHDARGDVEQVVVARGDDGERHERAPQERGQLHETVADHDRRRDAEREREPRVQAGHGGQRVVEDRAEVRVERD